MEFLPDGTIKQTLEIPPTLALLPIRDLVVFPYMIVPLRVTRAGVDGGGRRRRSRPTSGSCFLVAQRDASARTSRRRRRSTARARSA